MIDLSSVELATAFALVFIALMLPVSIWCCTLASPVFLPVQ